MAEADESEKTEDPTSKRLGKLREEGNVINSQEVHLFGAILAVLLILWFILPPTASYISKQLQSFLVGALFHSTLNIDSIQNIFYLLCRQILVFVIPIGGISILIRVFTSIIQNSIMWVPKNVTFKFNRVNPLSGFKRTFNIFSGDKITSLSVALLKLFILTTIIGAFMYNRVYVVSDFVDKPLIYSLIFLHRNLLYITGIVLAFMLVVAVADYAWQRYSFLKKNRMTKKEIKDEHKESEGDPLIKGKIRAIRKQRFNEVMVNFAERADVVITNPTHYAIALEYKSSTMTAPQVIAKGQDYVALRIKARAQELDIPIVEDPPLARALYATCDLEQEIPAEYYKAVAEIISYIMQVKSDSFL